MTGPVNARSAIALAICLAAGGCVQVSLTRAQANDPIADEHVAEARSDVGRMDLTECLRRFGAPQLVREHPEGPVLLWGWKDEFTWGFTLSVSFLDNGPSASVDWEQGDADTEGLALFFDDDLRLRSVRRGLLRDLVRVDRIRPQLIER